MANKKKREKREQAQLLAAKQNWNDLTPKQRRKTRSIKREEVA